MNKRPRVLGDFIGKSISMDVCNEPLLWLLFREMNLANFITSIRLILLPFIISSLAYGRSLVALVLLTIALLSDLVDGLIARKLGQITKLGQILDPLADKALFFALFGFFTWTREIPVVAFFLLLLPHFALIIGGGVLYSLEGEVIQSNVWGKTSSALLSLGLIAIFFNLPYALFLIYVGIGASYISATVYFLIGSRTQTSRPER